MSELPHLVGMVHLLPLPGSPGFGGSIDQVVTTAVEDAATLTSAGFPALLVENFGDIPFFPEAVPAETIAAMTTAVAAVRAESDVSVGVNVLRNDGIGAIAVAAATGSDFIRVNVLSGMMYTDQGPLVGNAAEVQRARARLCPDLEVWADVMVKHATPPPGSDPTRMALDTVERGGAHAIIVSGSGTGTRPDLKMTADIRAVLGDDVRIVAGSGAAADNLTDLVQHVDTVIVGSSLKHDGVASNRVDPMRAKAFVETAQTLGLV